MKQNLKKTSFKKQNLSTSLKTESTDLKLLLKITHTKTSVIIYNKNSSKPEV